MADNRLASLIYHDIFDYPLTEAEILRWEVGSGNVDGEVRSENKRSLALRAKKTHGYYHLAGRSLIVKLRKAREKESTRKLKLARKVARKLSIIPMIKFIGVTGSLAMNNARRESDIDLMIITTGGTLWATRLIVYLATKISRYQVRGVGGSEEKDAICFNLWVDDKHLVLPRKMRNLYTAHEVLQVVPLFNRDRTFEKFFDVNRWALEYWPHALRATKGPRDKRTKEQIKISGFSVFRFLGSSVSFVEPLAYHFQRLYMHRHRTRETVQKGRAFFHPVDWGEIVMREFDKRLIK